MRLYFVYNVNLLFTAVAPVLFILHKKSVKIPTIAVPSVDVIKKIGKDRIRPAVPTSAIFRCFALFFLALVISEPVVETSTNTVHLSPILLVISFLFFIFDVLFTYIFNARVP